MLSFSSIDRFWSLLSIKQSTDTWRYTLNLKFSTVHKNDSSMSLPRIYDSESIVVYISFLSDIPNRCFINPLVALSLRDIYMFSLWSISFTSSHICGLPYPVLKSPLYKLGEIWYCRYFVDIFFLCTEISSIYSVSPKLGEIWYCCYFVDIFLLCTCFVFKIPYYFICRFESLYIDDEIRVVKDIRKDYLIVERAPYSWKEWSWETALHSKT